MTDLVLYIALGITLVLLAYFFYRFSNLKIIINLWEGEKHILESKLFELTEIRLENIKQIQALESENKYLMQTIADSEKSRKEAFDSAKSAMHELGGTLSKQLLELHKQESKEVRETSEQKINNTAQKFHTEFERLVQMMSELNKDVGNSKSTVDLIKQSLLSPSGAGQLAEITLENILKASGLKSGIDFMMQHTISGSQEQKLRPDAVVFLPGGNLMVIDAKASKFLVDSEGEGRDNDQKLLKAMNSHLKSLTSKDYVENIITSYNLSGKEVQHVMMLMFLPTEHAVDKVTGIDIDFISKSWNSNIFPVGPSGLMNMLSFARFQINDNIRTENHKLIVEEMRKILSSISVLTDYSQKMGNSVQSLVNNYDKFSASFNRNFLPKVRTIQKLGIDMPNKTNLESLTRYQLVSSKAELIDVEAIEVDDNDS
jgi:DNA recombination protein RmuC